MVRLEGPAVYSSEKAKLCFNSYMVRLEESRKTRLVRVKLGFNSYMVRLEASTELVRVTRTAVSIPIWCDWKALALPWRIEGTKFQFLYGAIGSNQSTAPPEHRQCFNSYMVRLEAVNNTYKSPIQCVSIPIWCDWKD